LQREGMATKSSPVRASSPARKKPVAVPRSGSRANNARRANVAKNGRAADEAPSIGIDRADRAAVTYLLRCVLADQHVLSQKTRMCHWNLTSGRFDPLHRMFEEHYQQLSAAMDETAERIRMLGHIAPAGLVELSRQARLSEVLGRAVGGQEAIAMLLADHEQVVRSLREAIAAADEEHDDIGTADFFTDLLRAHEKTAWMLRSHLADSIGGATSRS
jgi:starvation-inducible DNA-binding protein